MNTLILERIASVDDNRVDVFTKLLQHRVIFVDDLFNDKLTADIVAVLFFLDRDSDEQITMFINSEGGDIRNTFAIYDAMKLISSPIETFCVGSAMREAVLLLAAGAPGQRLIAKNADVNISQIVSHYVGYSDLTNTKINHDKVVRDNDVFLKELSKAIKKPFKTLKKDIERQRFMTAKQAVEYGIADKVM